MGAADDHLREQADDVLRESLQTAWRNGSPGVRVRAETVEGDEWDELTEVADAADLGSVGLRCITYAQCPVAVVRPSRAEG